MRDLDICKSHAMYKRKPHSCFLLECLMHHVTQTSFGSTH